MFFLSADIAIFIIPSSPSVFLPMSRSRLVSRFHASAIESIASNRGSCGSEVETDSELVCQVIRRRPEPNMIFTWPGPQGVAGYIRPERKLPVFCNSIECISLSMVIVCCPVSPNIVRHPALFTGDVLVAGFDGLSGTSGFASASWINKVSFGSAGLRVSSMF
jgi:hypothetical protein